MPDYGHPLWFAANLSTTAPQPEAAIALARTAERSGLDLLTVQDHPYNTATLDAWTLLSHLAAHTSTIRLAGNVHPLPLRPAVTLARGAASLDRLSGGRIELGLGAGGYLDAIEHEGGPRLTPREAVDALDEGIRLTVRSGMSTPAARSGSRAGIMRFEVGEDRARRMTSVSGSVRTAHECFA